MPVEDKPDTEAPKVKKAEKAPEPQEEEGKKEPAEEAEPAEEKPETEPAPPPEPEAKTETPAPEEAGEAASEEIPAAEPGKKKKINQMTLAEIDAKLKKVHASQGGLQSKYARQLIQRKNTLKSL